MNQKTVARCLSVLFLGGALAVSTAFAAPADQPAAAPAVPAAPAPAAPAAPAPAAPAAAKPDATIKGTCTFNNKKSDWSAKLTVKADGTYEAAYISSWSGKPLEYAGTLKTDGKEISGTGKAINGKGNGSFSFSGKYGADGIAQCTYKEDNGRRSGTMTSEKPVK